jgi:hypothetical protein
MWRNPSNAQHLEVEPKRTCGYDSITATREPTLKNPERFTSYNWTAHRRLMQRMVGVLGA